MVERRLVFYSVLLFNLQMMLVRIKITIDLELGPRFNVRCVFGFFPFEGGVHILHLDIADLVGMCMRRKLILISKKVGFNGPSCCILNIYSTTHHCEE